MGLAYQSNKTALFINDKEIALGSGDASYELASTSYDSSDTKIFSMD